jgi:hypothetical protein
MIVDHVVRTNITNIPWGKMSLEKYGIMVRNSLNVLSFIPAFIAIVITLQSSVNAKGVGYKSWLEVNQKTRSLLNELHQ